MTDLAARGTAGLRCSRCGGVRFRTIDTRRVRRYGGCVRRYKACRTCGRRLVTFEVMPALAAGVTVAALLPEYTI